MTIIPEFEWYMMILALGATCAIFILLELVWKTLKLGIGPTPSGRIARSKMVELCRHEVTKRGGSAIIYELGSGWGGLALHLAVTFGDQVRVQGVELAYLPLWVSRIRAWYRSIAHPFNKVTMQISFQHLDLILLLSQLKGGEIMVCYLCPEQMQRLSDALKSQVLPPQITLISLLFALPNYEANRRETVSNLYRDPLWCYHLS